MLSPPPGRFSTTNGCPYFRCSSSASRRAKTSPPPPAASGMTIRTVRVGQLCAGDVGDCDVCADAVAPSASQNAAARNASPRCTIVSPGWSEDCRSCDATAGPVGMESVKRRTQSALVGRGWGWGSLLSCSVAPQGCRRHSRAAGFGFSLSCTWLVVLTRGQGIGSLLRPPPPTPPRPAAGLPASGKYKVTKPGKPGFGWGEGSTPSLPLPLIPFRRDPR